MKSMTEVLNAVNFPVSEQALECKGIVIPTHKAIFRDDTQQIMGIMSADYKLVRHNEAFERAVEGMSKVNAQIQKCTLTQDGARVFIKFVLPDYVITVRKGDDMQLTLTMTNSYDGSTRFGLLLGGYRLVCSNGLRVGMGLVEYKRKHTQGLAYENIIDMIQTSIGNWESQRPFFETMAATKASPIRVADMALKAGMPMKFVGAAFGQEYGLEYDADNKTWLGDDKIEQSQDNIWGMYNVFTKYITHTYEGGYEKQNELFEKTTRAFASLMSKGGK